MKIHFFKLEGRATLICTGKKIMFEKKGPLFKHHDARNYTLGRVDSEEEKQRAIKTEEGQYHIDL